MQDFFNKDCMEVMARYPDKYFDLAIVDPPYGISINKMSFVKESAKKVGKATRRDYRGQGEWDNMIPDKEYFLQLFRVSKNQIIWGGTTLQNIYRLQSHLSYGIRKLMKNILTILPIANMRGVVKT